MPRGGAETLPGLVGDLAARAADDAALIFEDETVSFGELDRRSACVAGALDALGVRAGDRVALWLPNCLAWFDLHLALARLGAITIAINTRFRAREVEDLLTRSEASMLAVWPGFAGIDFLSILGEVDAPALRTTVCVGGEGAGLPYEDLLAHRPGRDASAPDARCIAFTSSGTTGRPKLVTHAQRGLVAHARAVARGFGYDRAGARVLGMLPVCGVFGYDSALGALAGGAPVVLQAAFDAAEAASLVAEHRITHANGSDTMLLRLLEHAPDPPLREAGFAAFDGDPRRVVDAAEAAGTTAYMCYGSTEVQALLAHAPLDGSPERRAIAGGEPVSRETAVRVRSLDGDELLGPGEEGELEIAGPSVMAGYLGDDAAERDAFTADGFVRSGDLGRLTEHGFAFVARRGDVLRLGGFLVSPREIEAFLEADDAVCEASVVAAEQDGVQRPVAFVVARDGAELDETAAIERCRGELAAFKVPRRVVVLDELPATDGANGRKVQRAELRRRAATALQDLSPVPR
ncbi:MAG: fatty-acyl-CoA synthase [Solirubrobacteraceae bacterium]|nr:fatty-acyl-CoA synthase [Solirubrobacteraceae bacterium]